MIFSREVPYLKENLYKLEADSELLERLETQLWVGEIESTIALLKEVKPSGGEKFLKHLHKHRHRLINYHQVQKEQVSSIGSGAVKGCGQTN